VSTVDWSAGIVITNKFLAASSSSFKFSHNTSNSTNLPSLILEIPDFWDSNGFCCWLAVFPKPHWLTVPFIHFLDCHRQYSSILNSTLS